MYTIAFAFLKVTSVFSFLSLSTLSQMWRRLEHDAGIPSFHIVSPNTVLSALSNNELSQMQRLQRREKITVNAECRDG